ncbi:hypothetical protein LINPERPRIM_LOCUS7882, partial [Linum perenne]
PLFSLYFGRLLSCSLSHFFSLIFFFLFSSIPETKLNKTNPSKNTNPFTLPIEAAAVGLGVLPPPRLLVVHHSHTTAEASSGQPSSSSWSSPSVGRLRSWSDLPRPPRRHAAAEPPLCCFHGIHRRFEAVAISPRVEVVLSKSSSDVWILPSSQPSGSNKQNKVDHSF